MRMSELLTDQSEHDIQSVTDQWGWVLSLQATATQTWCRGLLESCSRVNPSRQAPASWTTDKLPSQSFIQSHQHSITHRHTHTDWSNSHFHECHWSQEVNDAYYILRWVVDDAKCIVVTRVSVCLSAAVRPHYCTDPSVTWGHGRGCPLVVHYWAICNRGTGCVAMAT